MGNQSIVVFESEFGGEWPWLNNNQSFQRLSLDYLAQGHMEC